MKGFEVYDRKTGERMLDRYAETDNGELLKQDAHGVWSPVPEREDFVIIPYNHTGQMEVY